MLPDVKLRQQCGINAVRGSWGIPQPSPGLPSACLSHQLPVHPMHGLSSQQVPSDQSLATTLTETSKSEYL